MALTAGTKLGPYEVQTPLGAGGMGEVYRARDTRLGRDVAIKVLSQHLSANPELKERFDREARAISSLNHPRICTLHDVGHQDGVDFLVMEYLEGESLAERLKKGPLPLKEALKIGVEVCEALAAAHRLGIIHRDLKPANIMLTKGGAKLMDFGLAKATAAGPGSTSSNAPLLSAAPTMSGASPMSPLTSVGAIVGTIQYMSPEQIEGKEADARSDLFALGAVLYETISGRRPFEGKSQISVASAILDKDPERISVTMPQIPPAFEHVITACLAKNPDDRFQTAQDVRLELKWIAEDSRQVGGAALPEGGKSSREVLAWFIASALAVALIVGAIWWHNSRPIEQTTYFAAPLQFAARDVSVSPNGHTVAVVGYREAERKNVISIYEPGSQGVITLPNTEGASSPFWSADGRSLAFFADGKLKKMEISGGPVQTLCEAPTGRGGAWNKDGVIIFTPSGQLGVGLYQIPASGGTPKQISFPDRSLGEDSHRWPVFLSDGTHYLYLAMNLSGRKDLSTIYVGSLNSNEKRLVTTARANAAYASGFLLYYREQTLFAQHFDEKKFALTGEPTPVLTDIQYSPRIAKAVFATTDIGLLVAQKSGETGISQVLWFDRKGKEVGVAAKSGLYGNIALAPDGKSMAVDVTDTESQNTDVWTYELEHDGTKRLTFDAAIDTMPVWSPDGKRLIFSSNRATKFDLFWKSADGAQEEKMFVEDATDKYPNDWSRDGKYVLYERRSELWFVTLPEQKSTLFLKAASTLETARFSPDGKWVAYASNESGKWEIYVTSFPDARGKWQVSSAGGEQPIWRADGKELFYLASDDTLMAAPVTSGVNFDAGTPVLLFQGNPRELVATSEQRTYDVSRDGQRFLINSQAKQAETTSMSVVQNWAAKLNK
jgi:eukaryotic-like serine/threonine-protein kinase